MTPGLQHRVARGGVAIVLLAPAGLMLALAYFSGGFFPDSTAVAAILVLLVLLVRATSAPTPFAGLSPALSVAAIALIGFGAWTLASGSWSGSPSRAALEYDRLLLYAAILVVTGILGRSAPRARLLLYGLAAASVVVSIAAAATWLLPDVFPAGQDFSRERLGWPTSYWNATGLIAALALVWMASLTSSATEREWVRVVAAAMIPFAAATLVFTVSRGAVAVSILGVLIAIATIRSRATPGAIATLAPTIGATALIALHVKDLNTAMPSAHALAAGHRTAAVLGALAVIAAALRAALLRLDRRLMAAPVRAPNPGARWALGSTVVALLLVGFLGLGGPDRVRTAVHDFTAPETQSVASDVPAAQRFTRLGNNGRIDQWRVAWKDGFRKEPFHGTGAGTYALLWTRYAPTDRRVLDAHSLYIEQLGELGIVGGLLLFAALGSMLFALARRARGPEREVWARPPGGSRRLGGARRRRLGLGDAGGDRMGVRRRGPRPRGACGPPSCAGRARHPARRGARLPAPRDRARGCLALTDPADASGPSARWRGLPPRDAGGAGCERRDGFTP